MDQEIKEKIVIAVATVGVAVGSAVIGSVIGWGVGNLVTRGYFAIKRKANTPKPEPRDPIDAAA